MKSGGVDLQNKRRWSYFGVQGNLESVGNLFIYFLGRKRKEFH